MSIRFPDSTDNTTSNGDQQVRLTLPTAAAAKGASTAYTTLFWFRTEQFNYQNNYTHVMLARLNGAASGTSGFVAVRQTGGNVVELISAVSHNSPSSFTITLPAITLAYGRSYLAMFIVNATKVFLVCCEVGGTATYTEVADTRLFDANMGTNHAWHHIGCGQAGTVKRYYGPMEEFCMWTGAFPESGGGPDLTLVQNIANGSQDLASMPAPLSARFRYRLRDATDLTDIGPNALGAMTPVNIDAPRGKVLFTQGPLRPVALRPKWQSDQISQAVWGTRGNPATAFADVRTPAGTYAGVTPTRIEARLLDAANAVVKDWTTVDPAPSGGAWVAGTLTGVPLTASFLRCEVRAMNGGAVVAGPTPVWGLRGSGFVLQTQAQSQLMYLFLNFSATTALPDGLNAIVHMQRAPANLAQPMTSFILASASSTSLGVPLGMRQAMIEINARFPGVPIQISTVGESGTAITEYFGSGLHALRWAGQKAAMGFGAGEPVPPFFLLFMGHSSTTSNYYNDLVSTVAFSASEFGTPIRYLHASVPRYRGAGPVTSGPGLQVADSRAGARRLCLEQPTTHHWMGSWSSVATISEGGGGAEPHPEASARGMGRSGGMIGYALMSAAGAIPDVPVGITALRIVGSTAKIEFGAINP